MRNFALYVLAAITLISCDIQNKNNSDKAIKDLLKRFPELPQNISDYKLSKSVVVARYKAKIELWNVTDSLDENRMQEVVVFYDSLEKYYAVPLFSNTFFSYYNFEYDHPIKISHKIHSSFDEEINTAMDNVYPSNIFIQNRMLTELFTSILNCRPLALKDTAGFLIFAEHSEFNPEDPFSCISAKEANIKLFLNPADSCNKEGNVFYHDWKNERAYSISPVNSLICYDPNNENFKWNCKDRIKIKSFRMCCYYNTPPEM